MEIRYFQIIVPLVTLFFIYSQIRDYRNAKIGIYETILIVLFWLGVMAIALFPDFFTKWIATLFGIKSNINALVFLALGLLFYFQLKLFKKIKNQEKQLTELARKIALNQYDRNTPT